MEFRETDLARKYQAGLNQVSAPFRQAIEKTIQRIEDHWPDAEGLQAPYSLNLVGNRLSIPQVLREDLSGLLDMNQIQDPHSMLQLSLELSCSDRHEEAYLSYFLDLLLDQFWNIKNTRNEIHQCQMCHRLFTSNHRKRKFCRLHNPKNNRSEYDRVRRLRLHPIPHETSTRISLACFDSFSSNDPSHLVSALPLLPGTNPLLVGCDQVPDYISLVRFITGRLDAFEPDASPVDKLTTHMLSPADLSTVLIVHEQFLVATPWPRKKPGPKNRLDSTLIRSIRGSGQSKRSYQEVADILANEHGIYVTRQAVYKALRA